MILSGAAQDPTDMCPPAAIARRMRIACAVCMRVMDPMRGNPLDRATFEGQRPASHQEIFHQLWHLVTTMSNQPVKAHADTQTAGDPVENDCTDYRGPTPEKESYDGGSVSANQKDPIAPFDIEPLPCRRGVVMYFVIHQNPLLANRSQVSNPRGIKCSGASKSLQNGGLTPSPLQFEFFTHERE